MINTIAQQQLIAQFAALKSWEQRYRLIMQLGKMLPALSDEQKTEQALLAGCESNVWFYSQVDQKTKMLTLNIDSDARIVKGLIYLIVTAHQGLTAQDTLKFDCEEFLSSIGLFNHLSPSRGNGIKAIINAIQHTCKA